MGIEVSAHAIERVHPDIRSYCSIGTVTVSLARDYVRIVCTEVLEDLSPREAERAVENFCRHSKDVLFSSTQLDHKEATHLNVQPLEHWAELFAQHGFFAM